MAPASVKRRSWVRVRPLAVEKVIESYLDFTYIRSNECVQA